jgi:hypothetical protein
MKSAILVPGDVPGELWTVKPMTDRRIASVLRQAKAGQSLNVYFKNHARHTCGYILPVLHKGRSWGRTRIKKHPGFLGPVGLAQGIEILAMINGKRTFENWSLHYGVDELGRVIRVELN